MNYYAIPPIATLFIVMTLGLFVLQKQPRAKINQLFFLFCMSICIWLFGYSIMYVNSEYQIALDYARIGLFGYIFIPILNYHFVGRLTGKGINRYSLISVYLLSFLLVLLGSTDHAYNGLNKHYYGYYPTPGDMYYLYPILFWGLFSFGVYLLFISYKEAIVNKNIAFAQQIRYVLLAFVVGTAGGVDYFIKYGLNVYPFGYLCALGFVFIISYAITRHKLMGVEVIIRKGLVYSILTAVLSGIYLVVILVSGQFLNIMTGKNILFLTIPIIISLAVLFQPLKNRIQIKVDQWFFPEKQTFRTEINNLSDSISGSLDIEQIKNEIAESTAKLGISGSSIVLGNENIESTKDGSLKIPLKFRGAVIGQLIVGQKTSHEPYSDDETAILYTLANQIAVAMNNAKLHKELLDKQKELLLADKFASLGRIAAGLAHEIRNPLTAIKGLSQSLSKNMDDREYVSEFSDIVPKEIDRLNNLVEELVLLGKESKQHALPMDINSVIYGSFRLFESYCAKRGVEVKTELKSRKKILGDKDRLNQVITNLIMNAVHAMPEGGKMVLATQDTEKGVKITVSDTGQGIPDEIKKELFEPFFSTKEEGAGLGLAVVRKIVLDHNGEIYAESVKGQGSIFTLELPEISQ